MHLDALLTLGYDAHYFGYTLDKLTHRVNLSAFTPPSWREALPLHSSLLPITYCESRITSYLKQPLRPVFSGEWLILI